MFRTEFRKITAVLSRYFGIEHIEAAEDLASETFIAAMETWTYKGIPDNPTAWLYAVARNKARNYLVRNKVHQTKIAALKTEGAHYEELDWSEQHIKDSQLQMLFAICNPVISAEAQIGLALRVLCGFGIEEIANAFLTNKETINKRLFRAREKLREEKIAIEMPDASVIPSRLENVLTTLYLLYSEGYYSETNEAVLRQELCDEAMRLTQSLFENELTNQPQVHALYALMCFHASRFETRRNEQGELVLYDEQDESKWNQELIARGAYHMQLASRGHVLSKYHLEAGIAYWHTQKSDSKEKWESILQLYNRLLMLEYTPVAALNRTWALYKVYGREEAIAAARKLVLDENPYYQLLLAELYLSDNTEVARGYLMKALGLVKTEAEKRSIQRKLDKLNSKRIVK